MVSYFEVLYNKLESCTEFCIRHIVEVCEIRFGTKLKLYIRPSFIITDFRIRCISVKQLHKYVCVRSLRWHSDVVLRARTNVCACHPKFKDLLHFNASRQSLKSNNNNQISDIFRQRNLRMLAR